MAELLAKPIYLSNVVYHHAGEAHAPKHVSWSYDVASTVDRQIDR